MHRLERDALGVVEVPADRLWGAQTQRALTHFAISTERLPPEFLRALALLKATCARVNEELGLLPTAKAQAIAAAAEAIVAGRHLDQFPLSAWQTGSGTQTHMNMNEVVATLASEALGGGRGDHRVVHPHDDVNLGQSSNDVVPSALHVAAVSGIAHGLLPALRALRGSLAVKATEFADLVKVGRTHLQDATPLSLGQEFSGYVAQLEHAEGVVTASLGSLYPLALGGTAVGTGLNTHPRFGALVAQRLAERTGLPFTSAPNKFAALAASDGVVAAHGALKTLAVALVKLATDLRWLASGPRAGLGELNLPHNEPGSSIMPGKSNPTQAEAMTMLAYQVMANDVAITLGGSAGNFELNVCRPLLVLALLQSIRLLGDGVRSLNEHCVRGLTANREHLARGVAASLMLVTALTPRLGYDKAAEIALRAEREGNSLKDAALALGYATGAEFDDWVVPGQMIRPGR